MTFTSHHKWVGNLQTSVLPLRKRVWGSKVKVCFLVLFFFIFSSSHILTQNDEILNNAYLVINIIFANGALFFFQRNFTSITLFDPPILL